MKTRNRRPVGIVEIRIYHMAYSVPITAGAVRLLAFWSWKDVKLVVMNNSLIVLLPRSRYQSIKVKGIHAIIIRR